MVLEKIYTPAGYGVGKDIYYGMLRNSLWVRGGTPPVFCKGVKAKHGGSTVCGALPVQRAGATGIALIGSMFGYVLQCSKAMQHVPQWGTMPQHGSTAAIAGAARAGQHGPRCRKLSILTKNDTFYDNFWRIWQKRAARAGQHGSTTKKFIQ